MDTELHVVTCASLKEMDGALLQKKLFVLELQYSQSTPTTYERRFVAASSKLLTVFQTERVHQILLVRVPCTGIARHYVPQYAKFVLLGVSTHSGTIVINTPRGGLWYMAHLGLLAVLSFALACFYMNDTLGTLAIGWAIVAGISIRMLWESFPYSRLKQLRQGASPK